MTDSDKTSAVKSWSDLPQDEQLALMVTFWSEHNEFPFPRGSEKRGRRFSRWLARHGVRYIQDEQEYAHNQDASFQLWMQGKYSW